MDLGLRDKRVLITGATSGIGRATAGLFAAEGARVAITYATSKDKAQQIVDRELGGLDRAMAVRYDLRDPESIEDTVRAVTETLGGIDVLVANSHWFTWGENSDTPYFEDTPAYGETGWMAKVNANVTGHMLTVQRAVKGMRERGWGRIVLLSSVTVQHGMVGSEYYGASRSAMYGFVRGLMWSRSGVLANVVVPGATMTESVVALADAPETTDMISAEVERTPSGRLTTPEEVGRLIVFLCSEANGNVNGEVIHTAGGR